MAVAPWATRVTPNSSTSQIRSVPGVSPAWAVRPRPAAAAARNAAAWGGAG